jgi:hypothetical protein
LRFKDFQSNNDNESSLGLEDIVEDGPDTEDEEEVEEDV